MNPHGPPGGGYPGRLGPYPSPSGSGLSGTYPPLSPTNSNPVFTPNHARRPHFISPMDKRKIKQLEVSKRKLEDPDFRERDKIRHLQPIEDDVTDPDNILVQSVRHAIANRPKGDKLIASSSSNAPVAPNDDSDIMTLSDAEDTISFLSSKNASTTSVKFVYLNRSKTGLRFRPYDLNVVMRGEQLPEHFVISASGVVHMQPGQPSEVMALSEWMRESTLFNVLTRIKFFRDFLVHKAFTQWQRNVRFKMYCMTRRKLCKTFFLSKHTFGRTIMDLHKHAYDLSTHNMIHLPEMKTEFVIDKFKEVQQQQRTQVSHQFVSAMDKMETKLLKLCDAVTQRANVPDLTTMESLEQYLLANASVNNGNRQGGKKMKSMVEAQQEQRERMKQLKRAMVEHDMLGDFIRLVDYVAAEHLFKNCTMGVRCFIDQMQQIPEKKVITFLITMSFDSEDGESNLAFIPSEVELLDTYNQLCDEMVGLVAQVTRLIYLKALKVHFPSQPKTFSVSTALRNDHRYNGMRTDTKQIMRDDFHEAYLHGKNYETYRLWHIFVGQEWPVEWERWVGMGFKELTHTNFLTYIKKVKQATLELEKMFNKAIGNLWLYSQGLRNELLPKVNDIMAKIKSKLIEVARQRTQKLFGDFNSKIKQLSDRPTILKNFAAFVAGINEIKAESPILMSEADEIEQLYVIAEEHAIDMPQEDTVQKEMVVGGPSYTSQSLREAFLDSIQQATDFKMNNLKVMSNHLDLSIDHINEELLATMSILNTGDYISPNSDTRDVLAQLAGVSESIAGIKEKVATYAQYQKLFEIPVSEWTNLQAIQKLYKRRYDIWSTLDGWQEKKHEWGTTPVENLDTEGLRDSVNDFFKKAFTMHKETKDDVTEYLLDCVKEEKQYVPCIMDLGNKNLKKEHWARIFNGMQKPFAPDTSYTLDGLRQWKIFDYKQLVEEQSAVATGEANLQGTLDKIKATWDEIEIETKGHRESKDTFIIGGVEEVMQVLEDNQVTMQTCLASRFVAGIRSRVESWDKKLTLMWEVIDEWVNVQKAWMYLEFIFSSDDIKRQLPEESRKFAQVDKDFRDLTKKAHNVKNCLAVCTEPGVLQMLKDNNALLDDVQKRLSDYLETKRAAFPRFYFLSDDELLAILSDVRNPMNVQPHLQKCFDNIKELKFKEGSMFEIIGMKASDGEIVPFSSTVYAKGNVESWLCQIEAMMRVTVLDQCRAAQKAFYQMKKTEWLFEYPAQAILTVDQEEWTKDTEAALSKVSAEGPDVLADFHKEYATSLEGTVNLVRGFLTKGQRQCVGTLIVVGVHSRDVIGTLVQSKCDSVGAFEWNMQLRYYWEKDQVAIKQTSACFIYGYEYLGNGPRLVITALTDRAYLTCTGALNYNLGAAPQGPAGTGKTESVKDLSKALARQCVVFNCSDGLDYKMMARMFSGLAQAGAWACFDEFNRIGAEVLSVIAQQMLAVTTAIATKAATLFFEGRDISVNPDFGVFITMNPGYAGRQELPDNLKALFRPVCLMVPDYGLIAEIMFYSEGFRDARTLAQKMQLLYRLSSEQLSKQDHYDFGMRAVKSILVMAGALKRGEPDLPEDMLLIRAMRDANIPKFLKDDAILFMALVGDLFPGIEIVEALNPALDEAIRAELVENNYEDFDPFVTKVIQLQETMNVRHGVMTVGQTQTGKTVCAETLKRALTRLHHNPEVDPENEHQFYQKTHLHIMNPKAVWMEELYGEVNEVTREWTDGILSAVARKVVRNETKERNWIVFDGPVDALWIENLNTVLDDNKMLCLVNGERIKIPDTVTFFFEVQDLRVASPATVSRCGMVLLEPVSVHDGWRLNAKRMNRAMLEKYPDLWLLTRLEELLEAVVPSCLTFMRANTREYVGSINGQLVESFIIMLESFLKNLEVDDDEPPEAKMQTVVAAPKTEDDDDEFDAPKAPEPASPMSPEVAPEEEEQQQQVVLEAVDMDKAKIFEMYALLSFVWSMFGNILGTDRLKADEFFRTLIPKIVDNYPEGETIYDWCVHKKSMSWVTWSYKIPKFIYQRELPFFSLLVPTNETCIFSTFLRCLLSVERNILINGPTGVGKSAVTASFLLEGLQSDSPDSAFQTFDISFSAQTSSKNLQERLESKLSKKRGATVLGAPIGKKLVFFVDDINMPQLEEYGASPPVELLRQVIDKGGLYDRKKIFWKEIQDLIVVAACGPPGGGKNELTPRISSKFHLLCFPTLPEESLLRIFRTIVKGFLGIFSKEVRKLAVSVVDATVEAYNLMGAEMRPTPSRSHYTFNMRDLSKVIQGILMVIPANVPDTETLVRLYMHECSRVFHDRLIDDNDRKWWWGTMGKIIKSRFSMEWKDEYAASIFCDFIGKPPSGPSIYKEAPEQAKIQDALIEYMMAYNVNFNKEEDLVFFQDAVLHLSRITRVLRQPRGNVLLVGVGGSGRQSLTRLAAFMGDMKLYRIEVVRGYGITEFRDDLRVILLDAGCLDKPLVFMLNDTQIANEQFIEDVNNILNTGEVPNLMQNEDMERIISSVSPKVKAAGKTESRETILSHFVYLCRENMHTVLVMSPIGDKFRTRLRMFPSLVNCMTIDWYNKWPEDALKSVAKRFFDKVEFDNDGIRNSVCELCVSIHLTVQECSEEYYAELQRRNYTTPTSYLELISSYMTMLAEQSASLELQTKRFQGGLDKLASTQTMVDRMKRDLSKMQPVLEQAAKDTAAMMVVLSKDQKIADEAKVVCMKEEADTQVIMDEAAVIKADCQKDLDLAMPAFHAAVAALDSLDKKDIDEVKSFAKPPEKVAYTLEAVCTLLKEGKDWASAKKVISDSGFLKRLLNYDKDNIPAKVSKDVQKYINDESFTPQIVESSSKACAGLCMWVRAIDTYSKVAKNVGPKKEKLAAAEEKLAAAQKLLRQKQSDLAAMEAKVRKLQESYEESVQKGKNLEAEMKVTEVRLERAGKLIGGLSSEKVRWEESVKSLVEKKVNLTGNMLIAAGAIAYIGPFTSKYRARMLRLWVEQCQAIGLPVDPSFALDHLTQPVTIRQWGIKGLPLDAVSIENGCIQTRARRWSLCVDPQGQANQWIKNMYRERGLKVIKLNDANILRTLESCIRVGVPVLLENVGEQLDPSLDPILAKEVYKQGGRMLIRLGDGEVDYDPQFQFFITTKLPNPHYMPELQIKVTIINFTVTTKGLEDQLLVDVVRFERAELEVQKDKLVVQIADGESQLKSLEDKILSLLAASGDDILDDEVLINTLAQSKKTSEEINKDLEVAEKTTKEIDEAREGYRIVSTRGSLIYSVIANIGGLEHMYQVSLQAYKKVFNQTMERTDKNDDVGLRIEALIVSITMASYVVICRGLFERDKLLYAFLMAIEILKHKQVVQDAAWDFFLRGSGLKPDGSEPPGWLPMPMWMELKGLSKIEGFENILSHLKQYDAKWKVWFQDDNPHLLPLPADLELSAWNKLILLKAMRPEKLLFVISQMVLAYMGQKYTESPPFDLTGCYEDSDPLVPLIFVLSVGSDPTIIFLTFAKERGFDSRKHMLSLGQDQGPKAEAMIAAAIKNGGWVYLQNCHLCASWMPGLEKVLEELALKELHPEFRLWLTSMPADCFPVAVLQAGMKIVKEPPKGLKANLRDTFTGVVTEAVWEGCSKPEVWKQLVFSLVFFHGVIQERRKFGPLGWNVPYEWNNSDLSAGLKYLQTYIEDYDVIPWPAVSYILGIIVYGGRVTDFLDLRAVQCILNKYLCPASLEDSPTFSPDGIYTIPPPGDQEVVFEYLAGLPSHESPEVFGLHLNANITVQQAESRGALDSIISLQPRGGGVGGASSPDETVDALALEFLERLPPPIDKEDAHPSINKLTPAGILPSLTTVLVQEVDRFNKLVATMEATLLELRRAIKGEVVMSTDLEKMFNYFMYSKVPVLWGKVGYPCLMPLGSWFNDFLARMDFLRSWLQDGNPASYWISAFFFPQGFLTGVLQTHSRQFQLPIDEVRFQCTVLAEQPNEVFSGPETGVHIHGVYLEGCAWDAAGASLSESQKGVLYTQMPVIHLECIHKSEVQPSDEIYAAPLYKTSLRCGVLSTTGLSTNHVMNIDLPSLSHEPVHWIHRGVALLCMLND
mmetsp:Transcript_46773/g.83798  ORF Transcript_46773/g.83798 Transcript_46773/m.83798 type:complete len:4084 (-) Transcript_46773:846-13097(-)